ncbi:MAG TPA: hypothetical protein VGN08_01320 [Solirubrobacteraceae bacterium]|jgi:hypothetical protein
MIGVFLLAWVVFPALTLVLSLGAGLGVRRVAGTVAVPPLLVVPVGLALLVVLVGLLCYFKPLAPLAGPACALVGVLGLVLNRDVLRRGVARRGRGVDAWALGAAAGAWAVIAAPVVLSGKPGFTGYGHIVDIAYQFDLAAHFAHAGRSIPPAATSAYQAVLAKYLASGYPGGGQWTLGALSNLTPVDLSWLYQPFLAFLSAMTAISLYSLLGRLVEPRPWRALGAFVAAQPTVLYAYALGGGIKELSTTCFLMLFAALLAQLLPRLAPGRALLAAPIALSASLASLSLTGLPWLGVLGAGVAVTVVVFQRERVLAVLASVQVAAVAFVLSLPTLAVALKLLPVVQGPGPVDLGNLSAPVPAISAAGVWISGDIRFPQFAHRGLSEALAIVVLVMAGCGLVWAARRRAWSVFWLGIAGPVALYYVAHRYGPWIQFKADTLTAPIILLLAFAGSGALMRAGRHVLVGALPALLVAAAVLGGNALTYHDTTLAPYSRLRNLQYIGERFAGQGPTLTPDFEEYAEYYLRDADQTSMVNGPTLVLAANVNRAAEPGGIFAYDLNEFSLQWLEGFRTIVMRRDPLASRPPSNYRLVYLSGYYEVWQRVQPPAYVSIHVDFGDSPATHDRRGCSEVAAMARKAGPRAQIAYMSAPSGYVQIDPSNTSLTGGFSASGGAILASGRGRASREQPIPRAGLYDFFINGSFGRPVNISVDGRKVGAAAYQVSYPGQWIPIGSRWLSRGVHHIQITRGGISLHAGNGDGVDTFNRLIGPLDIMPATPAVPRFRYTSVSRFRTLCRTTQRLRWVEVVRPA